MGDDNDTDARRAALAKEAARATELLRGKTVRAVWRQRPREVGIEFDDGTRLFVDAAAEGLELSVTGSADPADAE